MLPRKKPPGDSIFNDFLWKIGLNFATIKRKLLQNMEQFKVDFFAIFLEIR
jgi:hypothetical protein